MNYEILLNTLGAAAQLTRGLSGMVEASSGVFQDAEAAQILQGLRALKEANERLEAVVQPKIVES